MYCIGYILWLYNVKLYILYNVLSLRIHLSIRIQIIALNSLILYIIRKNKNSNTYN